MKDGQALLSHHLGDLDEAQSFEAFTRAIADHAALFDHRAEFVAVDLHPGYRATEAGRRMGLPVAEVQHHHAHLAACLGDALWPLGAGPVAGIVLDGTGLGSDGTIWGGELLLGSYREVLRVAHLAPAPLPGGEAAAREPWRNALVRLDAAGLGDLADRLFPDRPRETLRRAVAAGVNAPLSSLGGAALRCGRGLPRSGRGPAELRGRGRDAARGARGNRRALSVRGPRSHADVPGAGRGSGRGRAAGRDLGQLPPWPRPRVLRARARSWPRAGPRRWR